MSGANQFTCIFPDNIYKHLSGENVNLTKEDYDDLLRSCNKENTNRIIFFTKCSPLPTINRS